MENGERRTKKLRLCDFGTLRQGDLATMRKYMRKKDVRKRKTEKGKWRTEEERWRIKSKNLKT